MTSSNSPSLPVIKTANPPLQFIIRSLFTVLLLTFSWGPAIMLGAFDLRFADLLLVLLAGLWLSKWGWVRAVPIDIRRRPILILLLLFAFWTFTSIIVTVTPALTIRRIVRVWLLLIMVAGIYDLRPSFRWVANLFSLHILAQSSVAIMQTILQRDVGLRWLGEQEQMAKLGYNVLETGSRLILRVQGLAEHPNLLGITLVVPLLVVLTYLIFGERAAHSSSSSKQAAAFMRRWATVLPTLALLLGTTALFFTFSRAATLGGGIAVVFLMILGKGRTTRNYHANRQIARPLRILGIVVGILLVGTMLFSYRDVILSRLDFGSSILEQTSVTERTVQNRVGWRMVQASPLVGVGAHSARARFTEFLGSETRISHTIHNTVLLISAELGLPAGLLWLTLLLAPPIYAIRNRHTLSTPALAYTVALVPYLVTDFTSPASYDTPVGSLLHWLLLALWLETTTTT